MILIIDKNKSDARRLSEMFHYMGVISYGTTPNEALSEISTLYKAVIVVNPELLPDKNDYLFRLRSYNSEALIFAISEHSADDDLFLFNYVFKRGTFTAEIYDCISKASREAGITPPGTYKLAGIDASVNLNVSLYFYNGLPFTRTENMILRVLIKTYPRPVSAKEILKYAYKQSRLPEISNIRTHISVMNKKFRSITGRNLVTFEPNEGYRVLTAEVIEATVIV